MATNKNAVLRYQVLNKCFQNFGRKYYFGDLLEIVNEALLEEDPHTSGIRKRQLREDIRFMKSEAGYAAPIIAIKDGKKAFYRYEDKGFSINNRPINSTEAEQLNRAIAILQRFSGTPEFEWVQELGPMLQNQFGLKEEMQGKVMAFESNIDYRGYKHLTPIFNAIIHQRVLAIEYQPFNKEAFTIHFHPYYLKQYNNRWFAFGYNQEDDFPKMNLALDRILHLEETDLPYRPDHTDWEEDYFYDIIGVSRPANDPETIEILFSPEQAPYVQTKPIHPSQKAKLQEDGSLHVRLKLIPNYELEMRLLGFGEHVKVLAPESLQNNISLRLQTAAHQY